MRRFLLRRTLYTVVALLGATMVVFFLSRMLGDPRLIYMATIDRAGGYGITPELHEKLGKEFHLDDPVPVQYGYWLADVLRGDLGESILNNKPALGEILARFPATLKLAIPAWILATLIGVPLGVISAVNRGTTWDYVTRGIALLGQTLPAFWVAIMAILLFSVYFRWLPVATEGEGFAIRNYILPVAVMSWLPLAGYLRITRSAMLEILSSEYIILARAKGVSRVQVVAKHALRNALIPPLTVSGLLLAGFLTGTVLIEIVFAWPGVGRMAIDAVQDNNLPIVAGITLLFSVIFIVMNFLVDIIYAFVDPRIRYG